MSAVTGFILPAPSDTASLPVGCISFSDVKASEGIIRTSFKGKKGIYLWTKSDGRQYIGSSKDLFTRLSTYFKPSSLNIQSQRGSYICAQLLKYGYSDFTLDVFVLDDSVEHTSIEQYYQDNFNLVLNINRYATGVPESITNPFKPVGKLNSQFGKLGPSSPVWGRTHSKEQRAKWSKERRTTYFVYCATTLTFHSFAYGLEGLAIFLGVSINTAKRAAKSGTVYGDKWIISIADLTASELSYIKLNTSSAHNRAPKSVYIYNADQTILLHSPFSTVNAFQKFSGLNGTTVKDYCTSGKLWRNMYILSYDLIPTADNSLNNIEPLILISPKSKKSYTVYCQDPNTNHMTSFPSLNACIKALGGSKLTLKLSIKYGELYKGFKVAYTPFSSKADN